MNFNIGEKLVCPHCKWVSEDIIDDYIPTGVHREIGSIYEVECDVCYENIEISPISSSEVVVVEGE